MDVKTIGTNAFPNSPQFKELSDWKFTDEAQARFEGWATGRAHDDFVDVRNTTLHFSRLQQPLERSTVALVSTGGMRLRSQTPFDIMKSDGDWSIREIPKGSPTGSIVIDHGHYNHDDADRDVNCMFPLDRLARLAREGVIGGVSASHFSMMGFIPNGHHLLDDAGPQIARRLKSEGADLAVLTPSCPMCHRSVALLQNVIEEQGIATISLTAHPFITAGVGVPRAVYVRFPQGSLLGEPGDEEHQTAVLLAALRAVETIDSANAILQWPRRWRQA